MSAPPSLYGFARQKRMRGDKEISSNTAQSFTSTLNSLINSNTQSSIRPKKRTDKTNIFTTHNRNTAKRAKLDEEAFAQQHTTNGEGLDRDTWERSKRKMEAKARLYAAMKRGDVEDEEGKFGVDFDRKWAEGLADKNGEEEDDEEDEDDQPVEYVDEFGRTRQGKRAEAAQAARQQRGIQDLAGDRFTARPLPPSSVIYGDTIQHQAYNPDAKIEEQMAELAKKRDRSLTPPPDVHFDADAEIRTKGTGFFQFSEDAVERKRQMEELDRTREETERVRERKKVEEGERRKVEADEFLEQLAAKMNGKGEDGDVKSPLRSTGRDDTVDDKVHDKLQGDDQAGDAMDAMQRIEAALAREAVD